MASSIRLTKKTKLLLGVFFLFLIAVSAGVAIWLVNSTGTQVGKDDSSAGNICTGDLAADVCPNGYSVIANYCAGDCQKATVKCNDTQVEHANVVIAECENGCNQNSGVCSAGGGNGECILANDTNIDRGVPAEFSQTYYCETFVCTTRGDILAERCEGSNAIGSSVNGSDPGLPKPAGCYVSQTDYYSAMNGDVPDYDTYTGHTMGTRQFDPNGPECNPPTNVSCTITGSANCKLVNGKPEITANWKVTNSEGFDFTDPAYKVVVRIEDLTEGRNWFAVGFDTWWATDYAGFGDQNEVENSWKFPTPLGNGTSTSTILLNTKYNVHSAVYRQNSGTNGGVDICETPKTQVECKSGGTSLEELDCTGVTLSSTSIKNGDKITATANIREIGYNIEKIEFYWTAEPSNGNFCLAPSAWKLIGRGSDPLLDFDGVGTSKVTWNVSGLPAQGNIRVIANIFTEEGVWCTGNPSGVCNTDAQPCTACGARATIRKTDTPKECGETCTATSQCKTGLQCATESGKCEIAACVGEACTCDVDVEENPDWKIEKSGVVQCIATADYADVKYEILIQNIGEGVGVLEKVVDTLDPKVNPTWIVPGSISNGGTISGSVITWNLTGGDASFAPDESLKLSYTIRIPQGYYGQYVNTVVAEPVDGENFEDSTTVMVDCPKVSTPSTGIFDSFIGKIGLSIFLLSIAGLYMMWDRFDHLLVAEMSYSEKRKQIQKKFEKNFEKKS